MRLRTATALTAAAVLGAVVAITAAAVMTSAAGAAGEAGAGSGFPGDHGRPFDGLPFPPGPLPPKPPDRPLPKSPPLAAALEVARAIVDACRGYHVGVSIIDASGTPKLYYIPDGTDGAHAYTGFRKAFTALIFGRPTSQVGERTRADAALAARIKADGNLLTFAGGLPWVVDGETVGAVGVSGAEPSAKDEACGVEGLRRVRDPRRP